ncbi:MAG: prepilin-type N-terminal cleavage/methylation domain-containing protein [Candidatus Berkelbacteria bacterium]|nr:prepilin-type N-terminal cleavage/methylation domain-containing protein [Candidatus Berkelbacteria bacterium]MCR4308288.1 prepilin-type N-terminal cleavage/methylation domain-containing protein [Candidatus Berkelbacteria bacterium]
MRSNSPGYSLIELLVVIAVITVIGITSIPNLFNRNDRMLLDSSASQIRQVIIEAETRAQAPDKNDSSGAPQVFQVSFGKFTKGATATGIANGEVTTNTVALQRGLVQCDIGDVQGDFTTLRNIILPRGIFISSFYPSNQTTSDDQAVIRFAVGDSGFSCGSSNNPAFKSGQLFLANWSGIDKRNGSTVARYLVVTLGSQKVGDKRYVTLDRVTHQVAISRSNPQSYFTPVTDSLAPKWNDDNPPNNTIDPNKFTISVACGSSQSDITISYPRARDRINDPNTVDANLFVAYNINWKVGSLDQPLAINYFYDLGLDTVRFQFSTDLFTVANQPKNVTITVAAVDARGSPDGNQPAYGGSDNILNQRQKDFVLSCGSIISSQPPDPAPPIIQNDPGGNAKACNPTDVTLETNSIWRRLSRLVVGRAEAGFILICL